jgi:type IV secretion system protein VirB4
MASLATDEPAHRTLSVFCDLVQNRQIREALRPYTLSGNYGQLFDADSESLEEARWTMLEMGHLMGLGEKVILPALDYLFHRIEARFDGSPTLLILDEAWLFLAHPVFMRRLQSWLKTLRKKTVYVVFATQEVADAMSSPILPTILSACHTKIFLPDEEATSPAMRNAYRDMGLSDTEIQILARSQKKRDYYYRSTKGRRLFTLDLGPIALSLVGANSPEHHMFFDEMIKHHPQSAFARCILEHQGLHEAAKQLAGLGPNNTKDEDLDEELDENWDEDWTDNWSENLSERLRVKVDGSLDKPSKEHLDKSLGGNLEKTSNEHLGKTLNETINEISGCNNLNKISDGNNLNEIDDAITSVFTRK